MMAIKIEELINKQMNAFDNRDITAMMAVFSSDIQFIQFNTGEVLLEGHDACRKMYTELFSKSTELRAEIINSIVFENKMIVQEYIYGRNGNPGKIEQVIIFEVKEDKIYRVTLIR